MSKTITCECGRRIRPCNLERHRRARHMPRKRQRFFGTQYDQPALRLGAETDRRYDEHVPRGMGPHRFRIYRLRASELELVASAGHPEDMGVALLQLSCEGEFIIDDSVGVLDTSTDPGTWIVSPFTLGRRKVPDG